MKFAFLPLSKLIPQSKCHAVSWSVRHVYPVNATQGMQCHVVSCSVKQCHAVSCSVMQCSQCVPCWQSLWILWSAILKTTKPWWSKLNPTKCQASWNNTDFVLNPLFWIFRNQMFGTTGNHISTYSKIDSGKKNICQLGTWKNICHLPAVWNQFHAACIISHSPTPHLQNCLAPTLNTS